MSFEGGDAGETVFAADGDATLSGGGGNDKLFGDAYYYHPKGADWIDGGNGDDTIWSSGEQDPQGGDVDGYFFNRDVDDAADTLFGGAGDDEIQLSNDDRATGGSGADTFIAYSKTQGSRGALPVITDFTPGEDRLEVVVEPASINGFWDSGDAMFSTAEVIDASGSTLIRAYGVDLLALPDQTGLTIGFLSEGGWTLLDGTAVDPATLDVAVRVYPTEEFW